MLLATVFACATATSDPDDEAPGDTGLDSRGGDTADTADTDTGDTDTDETGESGDSMDSEDSSVDTSRDPCPPPAAAFDYVVSKAALQEKGVGFDLDGDGDADNAAGVFGSILQPALDDYFAITWELIGLQVWGVDDWCVDDVGVGILVVEDTDGDVDDNYSGLETFDDMGNRDGFGHAYDDGEGTITDATLSAVLPEADIAVLGSIFSSASPVQVTGGFGDGGFLGEMGVALPLDTLIELGADYGFDASLFEMIADMDTDADGEPDAVSSAWTFEAVGAGFE